MKKEIYLASPLGFSEVGKAFYYGQIVPVFEDIGYGILDPWKLTPDEMVQDVLKMPYGEDRKLAWQALNKEIFRNNISAIRRSRGIFAVLDGVDVDSGTASEIGTGYAWGIPTVGYRGDFRLSADNEGGIVNLQVEGCIKDGGGVIITEISQLRSAALSVFGGP